MIASAWRKAWPWLRVAAGVTVIVAVLRVVGASAFIAGLRAVDLHLVLAALAITALTTACCSWRWRLVIRGAGGDLRMGAALGANYRSEFLDATLPGGVLGDVYRGVRRGRRVSNMGRGLRTVFWDRVFGLAVQLALAGLALLVLPSPVRGVMPLAVGIAIVATVLAFAAGGAALRHGASGRLGQMATRVLGELRGLTPWAWAGIAIASTLAIVGYVAIFALAAHAVGVTLPSARLVPLLMLALVAAAVPFNVAGFGPREGVAAWAFGVAGAGAHSGVAAALLYGILGLIAVAPGALLLLHDWLRPEPRASSS